MKVKEESEKVGLKLNIQKTKIMASSWEIDGENNGNSNRLYFLELQKHCRWWLKPWNQKMTASWQESNDKTRQGVEKQRHYSADKGPCSLVFGLPSGHVQLWELDGTEGRVPKNWCFWTVVLEETPESSLESKEIKPVSLKGNQPWILVGRTDVEAETPVFWSSDANSWLIGKVPDAERDWGQEKRVSEDETPGCHHRCNGHELGQTLGDNEGQGGPECCRPWGSKESDTAGQMNNNNTVNYIYGFPNIIVHS